MSQENRDFGGFDSNQFGDQYRSPGAGSTPKKSTAWIWILLAVLGGGLLLLCCGGGAGLMYMGFGVISAGLESEIRDHPAIQEHIGEIESMDMNFTKSTATEGDDVFVFDVKGSKGTGTVTAELSQRRDGTQDVQWARLRTVDGETIELIP